MCTISVFHKALAEHLRDSELSSLSIPSAEILMWICHSKGHRLFGVVLFKFGDCF